MLDKQPPKSGMKGRVTTTYTVWCADCHEWFMATENSSRDRSELEWMGCGWVHTWRLGWVCPKCYNARLKDGDHA